jgi:hypothetical protein
MKIKNNPLGKINAAILLKWLPTLVMVALLGAVVLNVEGCGSHSH